jgi:hypothetical protein
MLRMEQSFRMQLGVKTTPRAAHGSTILTAQRANRAALGTGVATTAADLCCASRARPSARRGLVSSQTMVSTDEVRSGDGDKREDIAK